MERIFQSCLWGMEQSKSCGLGRQVRWPKDLRLGLGRNRRTSETNSNHATACPAAFSTADWKRFHFSQNSSVGKSSLAASSYAKSWRSGGVSFHRRRVPFNGKGRDFLG